MLNFLKSSKLAVNLKVVSCPKCGKAQPKISKPKNLKQDMWGGYTCKNCDCEMDKYGK